jgi:hypothetical protein
LASTWCPLAPAPTSPPASADVGPGSARVLRVCRAIPGLARRGWGAKSRLAVGLAAAAIGEEAGVQRTAAEVQHGREEVVVLLGPRKTLELGQNRLGPGLVRRAAEGASVV